MIVSVINIKGGVGKTTTAMALALIGAQRGYDVTLYDTDPQASASTWVMAAEEEGITFPFDTKPGNIATIKRLARRQQPDSLIIIDTPPSGNVTDAALNVADFVIVPVAPALGEIRKTRETIETLDDNCKAYAVLVNRVKPRTISYRELLSELQDRDVSYFETVIPEREALRKAYGSDRLLDFGYQEVFDELMEAMGDGGQG